MKTIVDEIGRCLSAVPAPAVEQAVRIIGESPRIFVAGAGRSGLAMRAFAMRLMHAGKTVHVVGDVTTPNIQAADWLIIGSGSGSTGSLRGQAEKAKALGAKILLITIVPESPIGLLADLVIHVPAPSPKAPGAAATVASVQPMGSLFEQCLFLLGDVLIFLLMEQRDLKSETMFVRHANLE